MNEELKYAGFWKRFLAHIIDQILLGIAGLVLFLPVLLFTGIFILSDTESSEYRFSALSVPGEITEIFTESNVIAIIFVSLILGFLSLLISWLYYALFESSSRQATPGKMILNLKVADFNGDKVPFGKATGRYFGKIISGLIFNIGYIMVAFTEKKQALHDMIAGCIVLEENYFVNDKTSQREDYET